MPGDWLYKGRCYCTGPSEWPFRCGGLCAKRLAVQTLPMSLLKVIVCAVVGVLRHMISRARLNIVVPSCDPRAPHDCANSNRGFGHRCTSAWAWCRLTIGMIVKVHRVCRMVGQPSVDVSLPAVECQAGALNVCVSQYRDCCAK